MTSIKFRPGTLGMVFVFGMILICPIFGQDRSLNGTWESSDGEEFIFNNGNFETYSNAVPNLKGTFITNNGKMLIKPTHIYGIILGLENRWYSINELVTLFNVEATDFEVTWDYFIRDTRLSIIIDEEVVTYIKK